MVEVPVEWRRWSVAFSNEPKRVQVVFDGDPTPEWAEQTYYPDDLSIITEDVVIRGILRTFINHGFDMQMVNDAFRVIPSWDGNIINNFGGDRDHLVRVYTTIQNHLARGGRIRDVPILTLEIFGNAFGLEMFRPYFHKEVIRHGAFTPEYQDVLNDLWTTNPAKELPRVQTH